MDSARNAGRVIGILLVVQAVIGITVNFYLLGPTITGQSVYLANAAPNANKLSFAALLLMVAGGVSVAIAATAWPVFKRYSERLAVAYFGLGIAGVALAGVEAAAIMSMLSLSKQYADSPVTDARLFEVVGSVVRYGRYWAHYTHLLTGSATVFLLYTTLFRFALVPRLLVGIGLAAVLLQMFGLAMPFFGERVNFYLLMPMGICHLLIALWLLARGFAADGGNDD